MTLTIVLPAGVWTLGDDVDMTPRMIPMAPTEISSISDSPGTRRATRYR
jgi:hypothetical protein